MSTFTILLGGDLAVTPRLMGRIAGSRVIAADSGMAHAALLGVTPELWIGDFDSADAALFDRYAHVERKAFPAEKDMTDGELALAEAVRRGASSFIMPGAFGKGTTEALLTWVKDKTYENGEHFQKYLASRMVPAN